MPLAHVEASGASPSEARNSAVSKGVMRKLSRRRCLLITYMRGREETGIVGGGGHFCAVIARLVEHPILELHEYVRILFESRVKVPVLILWLWGGAMDPLGDLPPFLLQMDGLMLVKNDPGRELSKVVGLELTQLGGLYMENPSRRLRRVNSSFSPLYSSASIYAKAAGVSGPFRPQREASSSPL